MTIRSLKQYLAESARSYKYKIKIAGSPSKNFVDLFCHNLSKYDPVKISEPKSTPVQKDPYGFPGLKDQSIMIIDTEFRYPVNEEMIRQLARLLNHDENMVRVIQSNFDDSVRAESEMYANQSAVSAETTASQENLAKDASKDYGDSYLARIRRQEDGNTAANKFAAKPEKSSYDPFNTTKISRDMNTTSPMSKISRPDRPPTGATKSSKK